MDELTSIAFVATDVDGFDRQLGLRFNGDDDVVFLLNFGHRRRIRFGFLAQVERQHQRQRALFGENEKGLNAFPN